MLHKTILILSLCFPITVFATPLWHCTATNTAGSVWNQFGIDHDATHMQVEKLCYPFNDRKPCEVVCFPPREYYRCVAHDTLPKNINTLKNQPVIKQGSWYWTSFSKQIAINGARDACRHNSAFGGCYVNPNTCATS